MRASLICTCRSTESAGRSSTPCERTNIERTGRGQYPPRRRWELLVQLCTCSSTESAGRSQTPGCLCCFAHALNRVSRTILEDDNTSEVYSLTRTTLHVVRRMLTSNTNLSTPSLPKPVATFQKSPPQRTNDPDSTVGPRPSRTTTGFMAEGLNISYGIRVGCRRYTRHLPILDNADRPCTNFYKQHLPPNYVRPPPLCVYSREVVPASLTRAWVVR